MSAPEVMDAAAYAARVVASAPRLSAEQTTRITEVLRGGIA